MATNIGPKVGIDGEAEYKQQMNGIIQQIKTLDAEMAAVTSSFDENTSSQEKAAAQIGVLLRQIDLQAQKVDVASAAFEKNKTVLQDLARNLAELSDKYGEEADVTRRAASAYEQYKTVVEKSNATMLNAVAGLNRMKNQVSSLESGMVELAEREAEEAEASAKAAKKHELEQALANVTAKSTALSSELKATVSAFDEGTTAEKRYASQKKILTEQIKTQKEKIELLEKALQESAEEFGENDAKTQKWKATLNDAKSELNHTVNGLERLDESVDDAGDSMEDAGQKAISMGDLIKGNVISQTIMSGLRNLANLFLSIGKAALDFVGKAVQTAQSVKALNAQYDQTFKTVRASADGALSRVAQQTGIVEQRLKSAATSTYAFAKASKATDEEALSLMERGLIAAADGAAYYDTSVEDMAETLQSFLKGNYANDAALGVSATEYTRNAAAVELYGKNFNLLTEYQKQDTLLKMVEDAQQLSGATGQAARESGEWTNQIGNLKSKWEEFLEKVGSPVLEGLLPILETATQKLGDFVEKVDWETFSANIESAFEEVSGYLEGLDWDAITQGFSDFIVAFSEKAPKFVEDIGLIADTVAKIVDGTGKFFGVVGEGWENFVYASSFSTQEEAARALADRTVQQAQETGEAIKEASDDTSERVSSKYAEMETNVSGSSDKMKDSSSAAADEMAADNERWASSAEESAARAGGAYESFDGPSANLKDSVKTSADEALKSTDEMVDGLDEAGEQATDDADKNASGIVKEWEDKLSGLEDLADDAYAWGADFSSSFADGIRSQLKDVQAAANELAQTVAEFMHHTHPDKGPMADDHTWGPDFIREFAGGMEANTWLLADAADKAAATMRAGFAQARSLPMPAAPTVAVQDMRPAVSIGSVVIDAKNVKEFNDVVRIAQREAMSIRQGYVDH